jgi:histidinol-phosphatase (PHP family)
MSMEELDLIFRSFISEAKHLRDKYEDKISLLTGLETEYITSIDLVNLKSLIAEHQNDIDYIVGSIHHVNEMPIDLDYATYQRAVSCCLPSNTTTSNFSTVDPLHAFFQTYFDAQYTLLTTHHPEVIGHFDLCRLYTPSISFEDYPSVMTKIKRNVQYAVDYGAVFEINTAAFRKGWPTPYPGRDVFEVSHFGFTH